MKKTALLLVLLLLLLTGCGEPSLEDSSDTSSAVSSEASIEPMFDFTGGEPPIEGNELWNELALAHPEEIVEIRMSEQWLHSSVINEPVSFTEKADLSRILELLNPEAIAFTETEWPTSKKGTSYISPWELRISVCSADGTTIKLKVWYGGYVTKEEGETVLYSSTKTDVEGLKQFLTAQEE